MSLIKKIKDYYRNGDNCLFTTPTHSQGTFVPPKLIEILSSNFYKADFSEIEGFDNLRNPVGVIKDLQKRISEIYKSKVSFMLVNGSTSGVIAAMMSTVCPNDKILVSRNCHLSVYNGLVLTGANPIWLIPDIDNYWGIFNGVKAEQVDKILQNNNDIKAFILTSPTYEGIFSDIESISKICKKHNVKLIVDEAHGALLNFGCFMSKPAILLGADISIQSLHKTAGAPNPCALLHLSEQSNINVQKIQNSLNLINTTSPSYPMMCAIEACIDYLDSSKGHKKLNDLLKNIEIFKKTLSPLIKVYEGYCDPTKLLLKIDGTDSIKTSNVLNDKYFIEEEYSTEKAMLFITGIGTIKSKLNKLSNALNDIAQKRKKFVGDNNNALGEITLPKKKYSPREAYFKEKQSVQTQDAINEVAGECIMEYPPGVPVILPGEIITEQTLEFCKQKEILICKD